MKALLGDGSVYEPMGMPWKALSYGSQWGLPDGEPLHPVTVDRVGTFFRNVAALRNTSSLTEIPPARIVCEVKRETVG